MYNGGLRVEGGTGQHLTFLTRANSGVFRLSDGSVRHQGCVFISFATALLPHGTSDDINRLSSRIYMQAKKEAQQGSQELAAMTTGRARKDAEIAVANMFHQVTSADHPVPLILPAYLDLPSLHQHPCVIFRLTECLDHIAFIDYIPVEEAVVTPGRTLYFVGDQRFGHAQALVPTSDLAQSFSDRYLNTSCCRLAMTIRCISRRGWRVYLRDEPAAGFLAKLPEERCSYRGCHQSFGWTEAGSVQYEVSR